MKPWIKGIIGIVVGWCGVVFAILISVVVNKHIMPYNEFWIGVIIISLVSWLFYHKGARL